MDYIVESENILRLAGFEYMQGFGYLAPFSKHDKLAPHIQEAIDYQWNEFDCEFYWLEDGDPRNN